MGNAGQANPRAALARNEEWSRAPRWLPAAVQAIIADIADEGAETGFVFAATFGGPLTNLHRPAAEVCRKFRIERTTPHDLRRTHGTTITRAGFTRDQINRIQNHREGGIGSVYDRHHYSDENKHVIEVVASRILALVEGRADTNVVPFEPMARSAPPSAKHRKRSVIHCPHRPLTWSPSGWRQKSSAPGICRTTPPLGDLGAKGLWLCVLERGNR